MKNKIIIAASILSANFAHLGSESKNILKAGADCIHFDVMDHHFVPNLSFGSVVCEALRKDGVVAEIDVHLMVTNPDLYIEPFAKAGATRLTFHPAALRHRSRASAKAQPAALRHRSLSVAKAQSKQIKTLCDKIHAHGMQTGLAFNPDKPIEIDKNIFDEIDMILLMSVFAGFGGQSFMPECLEKISGTKKLIDKNNPKILLGVDGGIKLDNIASVVKAGANFIVMGSGLFNTDDYALRVKQLRDAIHAVDDR
ncbi:MAG TPA: ribulose-phosphate 3-epimerase [Coxiellaceae bacterium]|nr:ribulose-phosphate 3-epimerase [Coxiellaceae bacterium]